MATVTLGQLVTDTREYMDAVGSTRWSDNTIKTVLNNVFDNEWSSILNAAPYYRFAQRQVTTDVNGQFAFTTLDSGSGDSQQNFYRIMSVSDGNVLYNQTRYQDVPLATTTNYLPTYPRLYYIAGQSVQILPVSPSQSLYVGINYKPTSISDLAGDTSIIDYPDNCHLILVWMAAAQLLLKGGTEAAAAANLKALADDDRKTLLDDIRRMTINPTMMAYPDQKYDWSGG
jgi:hypothetical protein